MKQLTKNENVFVISSPHDDGKKLVKKNMKWLQIL